MNAIVIGQFSAVKKANRAVDKLLESCVSDDLVRTFLLGPSAKRSPHGAGSTCQKIRRSASNDWGAAQHGPVHGLLDQIGDKERRSSNRSAGILVAVETPNRVSRALAVSVLREHGACIVDSDVGCLLDGNWAESDLVSPASLFDTFDGGKRRGPGFVPIEIERL